MNNLLKHLIKAFGSKRVWIIAYLLAFIIRVAISLPLMHDWDGFVFTQSAKNLLEGVTPYQTVEENKPFIYPDSDLPMTEQWYGYPPLPLLMFTTPYALLSLIDADPSPILQNFSIKLPFILGDLFCAYLVKKFLDRWSYTLGNRGCLLILFNPLLIWISAAWGMFDIWIINFIVLFLISIRYQKSMLAGVFLALASQIKLFPLFFLPASMLYFFQKNRKTNSRLVFVSSFILTTLIIDIPFFLSSPQGFMNQNLLMHMARPPQGIGLVAIFDYLGYIYSANTSLFVAIGSVLTMLSIILFNLFAFGYIKGKETRYLTTIFLIYISTLLFNKVVNEQYYVVLICLLIIMAHIPVYEKTIFSRRLLVFMEEISTISVLLASVVLGFHFLTFIPPFLAEGVLKASTNYLVYYFSQLLPLLPLHTYPNSLWTYYNLPVTVTYLLLLPLIFFSFFMVMRGLLETYRVRQDIKETILSILHSLRFSKRHFLFGVGVLLITTSLSIPTFRYLKEKNAFMLVHIVDSHQVVKPYTQKTPGVGIFYNVWWNNPSHNPAIADDAWNKTTLTPLGGYYTSKNSYFVEHINTMKEIGIDFAVISYHLYDRQRFLTFTHYAEQLGFSYAPMVESDDALSSESLRPTDPIGNPTQGYKVGPDSQTQMANHILSAVVGIKDNSQVFRIDNKIVVYVYDGHFYLPSWDSVSKRRLAQRIYDIYREENSDPYKSISKAWDKSIRTIEDIIREYPSDIHSFNNHNKDTYEVSNDDYRQAFLTEYTEYWKEIKKTVENEVGPIYLISTYQTPLLVKSDSVIYPEDIATLNIFNNEFYYSLSNTWSYWRNVKTPETIMDVWEQQEEDQTTRAIKNRWPVFLTVTPTYKDTNVRGKLGFEIPATVEGRNVYEWTWETARKNNPDYILIATWNEFFEGSAIEPSVEYGNYYLEATKRYIREFKQQTASQSATRNK